jgi:(2Fe-2S) ferredoxin
VEEQDLPFQRIIFVCVNQRDKAGRVCCAGQGGVDLQEKLKDLIKKRGLKGQVRVSKSGCMDRCEQGPNVMIFPDNVWLCGVKEHDLPAIVDRIARDLP